MREITYQEAVAITKVIKEWKSEIRNALEKILVNFLKKAYPYVVDVADVQFDESFFSHEETLFCDVYLFVKPEFINKINKKIQMEVRTLLEMMQLNKKEVLPDRFVDLEIRTWVVSSE